MTLFYLLMLAVVTEPAWGPVLALLILIGLAIFLGFHTWRWHLWWDHLSTTEPKLDIRKYMND